jgi:hypothetical protein
VPLLARGSEVALAVGRHLLWYGGGLGDFRIVRTSRRILGLAGSPQRDRPSPDDPSPPSVAVAFVHGGAVVLEDTTADADPIVFELPGDLERPTLGYTAAGTLVAITDSAVTGFRITPTGIRPIARWDGIPGTVAVLPTRNPREIAALTREGDTHLLRLR